jgi:hypothetical protein
MNRSRRRAVNKCGGVALRIRHQAMLNIITTQCVHLRRALQLYLIIALTGKDTRCDDNVAQSPIHGSSPLRLYGKGRSHGPAPAGAGVKAGKEKGSRSCSHNHLLPNGDFSWAISLRKSIALRASSNRFSALPSCARWPTNLAATICNAALKIASFSQPWKPSIRSSSA